MGITLGKKQLNKRRVSLYLNYSYNGKRRKEYLCPWLSITTINASITNRIIILMWNCKNPIS